LHRFEEPIRFLVIGGINTLVGYGLFAFMLWLLTPLISPWAQSSFRVIALAGSHSYAVIQWVNWATCVPFSTFMMRRFVFKKGGSYLKQVGRAYGVYLPAQLVASVVLILCVRIFGFAPLVGQAISIVFSTIISYLGHKFFTFRVPHT